MFQILLIGKYSILEKKISICFVKYYFYRFMGSLTALLVLASLMSTLTTQLPKTSYFKVFLKLLINNHIISIYLYVFNFKN